MTRPWLIWLLSLLCAAGIFGAMGVITHRTLSLEQESAQARADAELQERIRLALWRMETEASALMIEENNRPPEHFHAKPGAAPSPLSGQTPKHVRLHFEIAGDGGVSSPQAKSEDAAQSFARLRQLLARSPTVSWRESVVRPVVMQRGAQWDNRVFLETAAKNEGPFDQSVPPPSNDRGNDFTQVGNGLQQGVQVPAEAMKQQIFNTVEQSKRAQVYTKVAEGKNYLKDASASQIASVPMPATAKPSLASAQPSSKALPDDQPAARRELQLATAKAAAPTAPSQAGGDLKNAQADQPRDAGAARVASEESSLSLVTPFRPFWLEDELFLVREVATSGRRQVQGVWLDAASLRKSLLDTIADILPRAALQPVAMVAFFCAPTGQLMPAGASDAGNPMDLVGLPWRLLPGENPLAVVDGWTPMRLTLAAAWVGALLAALAAAGLLFGVTRLSERRAAFVSSVTHELRTPLTTFRLYSELLEQGMVREEADRAQYLHTLRTEAERLTHLVDNVLAYSRIERTNRHSRTEHLELTPWLERVKGRLEDRTREAGMKLDVSVPPDAGPLVSVTDATALEQILFNLVDNACKYAAGRCADPLVRVMLERRGRWVELRVCDSGPGIARGERSRLFRPFHKSADEAANSKPGVGLGLALCHRLAGALGGKLALEKTDGQGDGACFVLRLPAA